MNGILCAEYADGTFERIIFNPLDLETTANLTEIQTWARETATIESYLLTISLAFLWFIVAFMGS